MAKTKQAVPAPKKVAALGNVGLKLSLYDADAKAQKQVSLAENIFAAKVNQRLLAQYVRVFLANQRQGTLSTKTRGEVAGTTKKVYRQKGTGRARHGAAKAPIFVGGGVTFGPKPRDFSLKMNKKQIRKALTYALTSKASTSSLIGLVDQVQDITPKTKLVATLLKNLGIDHEKTLLIVSHNTDTFTRAVRNIKKLAVVPARDVNPYAVLMHKHILVTAAGLQMLTDRLSTYEQATTH